MRSLASRFAATLCAVAVPVAVAAAAAARTATDTITRLNAALLETLKQAETLGFEGRFTKLRPVVAEVFDVDFMAEKSIGKHWKTLSDADKKRWRDLFQEYTAATYAGNFDRFSGQRFEMGGEEPAQNDTRVVHTTIVDPAGETTELDYRLHDTPKGPKVIDVQLKGTVSQLALQRADFTSALDRGGFDALLATIRGKIDDLAAGRGKRQSG